MNLAGYPGVTSPSARPPLDALQRADTEREFEDRVSGATSDGPNLTIWLDYPRRNAVLDLEQVGRLVGELISLIDGLSERGIEFRALNSPMDTHVGGLEPFCRSRPPSLRWRATSLASVCGRAPSPPGRADGKGAPHRDSRAATLRSESLGRPRPLDPRYQLWSRRPHSARARSTTASLSAERSRVRASGCLPHEVASSAAPRHGAMEEQRR